MRAYWAIVSARFRTLLQYRAAAFAGLCTQLFWGLIRVMIFSAFYRSTTATQPMSFSQVVTYIWLGQAFLLLIPMRPDEDVQAAIRTGTVAYELVRPLDLYGLWYCRGLAQRIAPTLLRAVPLLVIVVCLGGLKTPPSLASGLAWAVAMPGAFLLSTAFTTLMTISLLWTISGDGIARFAPMVMYTFSGMLLPLPLFPGWAQPLLNALPFRDLIDVPFRLYAGNIPPEQIGFVLAHQAVWTVGLILLGRGLLARGARRVVVQGG